MFYACLWVKVANSIKTKAVFDWFNKHSIVQSVSAYCNVLTTFCPVSVAFALSLSLSPSLVPSSFEVGFGPKEIVAARYEQKCQRVLVLAPCCWTRELMDLHVAYRDKLQRTWVWFLFYFLLLFFVLSFRYFNNFAQIPSMHISFGICVSFFAHLPTRKAPKSYRIAGVRGYHTNYNNLAHVCVGEYKKWYLCVPWIYVSIARAN